MSFFNTKKELRKYKFCTNCGNNLKHYKKQTENLLICISCGYHFYVNPRPTNAAILKNKKGEILLVKRKYPPKKNFWDLPGGFIDLNETAEESMKRELLEELGIKIKKIKYFSSYTGEYPYQRITYPTLGFIYVGKIGDQKLNIKDDVAEIKFFNKKNIPFEKIAFNPIIQALKEYLKITK